MFFRFLFLFSCLLILGPLTLAQSASSGQPPVEEQNETMIDTLKRMQIKREENEHKKLLEKGTQIKEESQALAKEVSGRTGDHLPRTVEKKLKEIEKFARQIRSESGGSQDEPLDSPPASLAEALKQLQEASERLNTNLAKTSRRVVSLAVVDSATEVIQLVRILRGYFN
jgi:hypothetical protein